MCVMYIVCVSETESEQMMFGALNGPNITFMNVIFHNGRHCANVLLLVFVRVCVFECVREFVKEKQTKELYENEMKEMSITLSPPPMFSSHPISICFTQICFHFLSLTFSHFKRIIHFTQLTWAPSGIETETAMFSRAPDAIMH